MITVMPIFPGAPVTGAPGTIHKGLGKQRKSWK